MRRSTIDDTPQVPLTHPHRGFRSTAVGIFPGAGRRRMFRFLLTLWVSVSMVGSLTLASVLQVEEVSRSLQPGEVVVLNVMSAKPLASLEVAAFERNFPSFQRESPNHWTGVVGIDLNTQKGSYPVILKGITVDGEALRQHHLLEVQGKEFPVRRLTVDEKFVTPPASQLERIKRESRQVSQIFARVTPERLWNGQFQRPVPGAANSSFGKRSILNGKRRSPHSGTDFTADTGTPVRAPNSGRVVLVKDLFYSGNTVIVDHGQGLYSYFAHLSAAHVAADEMVESGQVLGEVGATGRVTGPHLHWTVRLARTRVDPLALMALLQ